jgi:hypothetical protein
VLVQVAHSDSLREQSDRVTKAVSLIDLRLRKVDGDLLILSDAAELEGLPEVTASLTRVGKFAVYDVSYQIAGKDNSSRRVAEVSATFTLVFRVETELSDSELQAFGAMGVVSVAHPYIRELFQSLTSKMGIPPLILEVMPPEPRDPAGLPDSEIK